MYRSKLMLDLSNPSVQQALRNVNDMHRNIMKAFDDFPFDSPRAEHSVLYSLMNYNGKPAVYVISKSLPDWSRVRGFVPIDEPADITGLREKLNKDCAFGFRLFASPTKKVARDGKLSSPVFLKTADERDQWLHRQAQKSGFELISFSEVSETKVAGRKKDMSVNYTGVLFTGVLRIVDPDLLWKAYCEGIGPGKAYGLGMLMIRRL